MCEAAFRNVERATKGSLDRHWMLGHAWRWGVCCGVQLSADLLALRMQDIEHELCVTVWMRSDFMLFEPNSSFGTAFIATFKQKALENGETIHYLGEGPEGSMYGFMCDAKPPPPTTARQDDDDDDDGVLCAKGARVCKERRGVRGRDDVATVDGAASE